MRLLREPLRSLWLVLLLTALVLGGAYVWDRAAGETVRFVLSPVWAWPIVLAITAGLLALVMLTYPQRVEHLRPGRARWLLRLRLLAAIMLVLAMLRPAIEHRQQDRRNAVLYIVADASRSMGTQDGPGGISRRQALLDTLEESGPLLKSLGEEIEVRFFDFAEALVPTSGPDAEAGGNQSAIGQTLEDLLRESRSDRVAGIVLMSDGAQRAIAPNDADPRSVARRLGEQQIPVFTVPFGGSGVSEGAFDLAVEDLLVDPLVFEKKTVPVNAKLRVIGAAGRDVTVQLLVEDRTGKAPGETGELRVPPAVYNAVPAKVMKITRNAQVLPIELSFVPDLPGEFKIAVRAIPLEGELKQANNQQQTILTVRSGGINVAYFDKLRPEQKFLRLVNNSEKIQLDYQPVRAGQFAGRTKIDPRMFERGRYDGYIIGDVPAEVFGDDLLKQLAARVSEGAGLMMLGGYRSFSPGGYANTPIAPLLPVLLEGAATPPGGPVSPVHHEQKPVAMVPTRGGLRHFIMRIDSPENIQQAWSDLPPLQGANKLRMGRDGLAEVFAESPDGLPLLVGQEVSDVGKQRARVLAFAGDTTYQWVLAGHEAAHQRFWQQTILWLTRKDKDTDQSVWAHVEPRNFDLRETVTVTMGARDAENVPVDDASFEATVHMPPDKQTQQIEARAGNGEHTALFAGTQNAGDYWVRVQATAPGKEFPFPAWTRFIVDARDLELDNPAADLTLLEEISALTGGTSMPPEQLGSFLQRKIENDEFTLPDVANLHQTTLWDNWPFLLLFVGIITGEWILRKTSGLV